MIVETAKIFAKQNGGRLVEIVDSALLMLRRHCYHVIIEIIGNRDYRESVKGGGLTASGKYLTVPDRFPRAD